MHRAALHCSQGHVSDFLAHETQVLYPCHVSGCEEPRVEVRQHDHQVRERGVGGVRHPKVRGSQPPDGLACISNSSNANALLNERIPSIHDDHLSGGFARDCMLVYNFEL